VSLCFMSPIPSSLSFFKHAWNILFASLNSSSFTMSNLCDFPNFFCNRIGYEEIVQILRTFYCNIRQRNGELYAKKTMISIRYDYRKNLENHINLTLWTMNYSRRQIIVFLLSVSFKISSISSSDRSANLDVAIFVFSKRYTDDGESRDIRVQLF
jgi:hypothetical protein